MLVAVTRRLDGSGVVLPELAGVNLAERNRKQTARHAGDRRARQSQQLSAGLALDKGFALAEEGQADRGLLWMLEALKTAPDDAAEFRRMVRWNLGAWLGQVHKPLRIIETGGPQPVPRLQP